MDVSRIAIFELCLDHDGLVKTAEERHYRLVPADLIAVSDREIYRRSRIAPCADAITKVW